MALPAADWPSLAHRLRLHYEGEREGSLLFAGSRGLFSIELRRNPSAEGYAWRATVAHPRLPSELLLLSPTAAESAGAPRTGRTGDAAFDAQVVISGPPGKLVAALDPETRARVRPLFQDGTGRVGRGRVGFERTTQDAETAPPTLVDDVDALLLLARRIVQVLVPMDLVEVVRCDPDPEIKLACLEAILEVAPEVLDRLPPEVHGLDLSLLVRRARTEKDRRGRLSVPDEGGALSTPPDTASVSLLHPPPDQERPS